MKLVRRTCFVLLLHLILLTCTDGAPQCASTQIEFNNTDLENINCIDTTSLSNYPNNSITWMLGDQVISNSLMNNLNISTLNTIPAGINMFQCNFTFSTVNGSNVTISNSTVCNINVTINTFPTLDISPNLSTILYPNNITQLNCTASGGHPMPSFVWKLGSIQVSSNNILNFSSNEMKIGDNQVFVCVATTGSLGDKSTNITITVQAMPPSVSLSPSTPSVFIGNSSTFTCNATSPLTIGVVSTSWKFNDAIITTGSRFSIVGGNTLTINNVNSSDAGTYTCSAFVINSENKTVSTQLFVISPPPRVSIERNDTSQLTVNDSIELTCIVTPLPFDDNLNVTINWTFPSTSSRTPSDDATQTITNLQLTDRETYVCSASVGNSAATTDSIVLSIVPLSPGTNLVITSVDDVNPLLGNSLAFRCEIMDISGSSVSPNITWYFNSTILPGESNTTLTFDPVMLDDTGDYNCNATIDGSEPTMSNVISIVVYQMPQDVMISPVSIPMVVESDTSDTIQCTAKGIPKPAIIWFDGFNGYYSNPLDLSQLNNTATGKFTCRATNAVGSDSRSLNITIVPAAPDLSISTSETNPVLFRNFSLTCDVDSTLPFGRTLSDFKFEWTISGENTVLAESQNYTFNASLQTNNSAYECSATVAGSEAGNATGMPLMLQSMPTIRNFQLLDPISRETYEVYIGITYQVVCEGDAVPTPSISLIYSGDPNPIISPRTTLPGFTQVDAGGQGSYTCNVSNAHGSVNRTKTFMILKPVITTELVSNTSSIEVGEPFRLTCSVSTVPLIPLLDMRFKIMGNITPIDSPVIKEDNGSATVDFVLDEAPPSDSVYSFFCTVLIQGDRLVATSENTTVSISIAPAAALPLIYIYAGISGAAVVLFFLLIILVILAIVCCCVKGRGKRDIVPRNTLDYIGLDTPIAEPTGFSFPILVANFSETYEMLLEDNQQRLKEQYSQLSSIKAPAEEAKRNINATKNRYPDVLAYDHSRVVISKSQGSDYINANLMDGFRPKSTYIAAQGPLGPPKYQMAPTNANAGPELNTVGDFWRMIWEHNISTVVMLTNLIENNRIKCAVYWPEDTRNYGRIRVRLTEECQFCDYIIRKFLVERIQVRSTANAARQVTQFHFIAWPDHGVPLFPISMLQFVKRVRSHINHTGEEESAPNLVHCSAGVGRTGTFICLDILLQQLAESAYTIDIWKQTSRLRHNRNHMIQEYLQFEFVHQAINEHIHFGDTECSSADFPKMISHLNEVTEENPYKIGMSRLEVEFKKLHMKVMANQHRLAMRSENSGKNRFINTMPFDNNCVKLNPIPGIAGSDYINASYIDSDKTHRAFIATQGPLKSTMEDFWRMIIDIGSNIVVMLTENTEDKTEDYFSFSHIHHGPFHVQTVKKHIHNDYVHRELLLRVDDKRDAYNIHHFQLTKLLAPVHSMKDCAKGLLSLITGITVTVQPEEGHGKRPPMVVHCGTGNGMTGVFITVCVILQRLEYEDRIDVFNTVKRLRMQRVAMVQTVDQYDLCYRTVMEYLQSSPT